MKKYKGIEVKSSASFVQSGIYGRFAKVFREGFQELLQQACVVPFLVLGDKLSHGLDGRERNFLQQLNPPLGFLGGGRARRPGNTGGLNPGC